jgi:hypothetical protein
MDMPNTHFNLRRVSGTQVITTVNGRPVSDPEFAGRFVVNARGGIDELGEPDMLYRNVGGTNFVLRSFTDGSFLDEDGRPLQRSPLAWGLSVAIRDINQDRRPDIYVCNDFDSPEDIWLNQGGGRFRAIDRLAMRKSSFFSMGLDFADINRDGHDDFFVLDMLGRDRVNRLTTMADRNPPIPRIGEIDNRPGYMMNTLFLNRGDGTYAEIAHLSGVAASDWSWAAAFLDVDLDGWEDLLVSNGHERAARHMDIVDQLQRARSQRQMSANEILEARKIFPRLANPNVAFRNRRDLTFEEAKWGFDYVGVSHGLALADLDNDGDLDVVVNNLNDAAGVYRNNSSAPRLGVRLRGKAPNTFGIGARIEVHGGPVTQSQEMMCGGKYLSCDEPMRAFAAGTETNVLTVRVSWLSGKQTIVSNAAPNYIYEVSEDAAREVPAVPAKIEAPLFAELTAAAHRHIEVPFDDFTHQPLLPHKLSQLGPGLAWADIDGDGWEDLLISSGRGGQIGLLRNVSGQKFESSIKAPLDQIAARDQTALLPWKKAASETVVLAGWSNYEDGVGSNSVRAYNASTGRVEDNFPHHGSAVGPLAMADVDNDGDLDLFVGGRSVPGKYPLPPKSLLLRNNGSRFEEDLTNSARLSASGMISGAVFSDIDSDNDPDLLLACDWGPPRLFRNDGGVFTDTTTAAGLDHFTGWWNGISTADFNGDGRQDIVASNWGRNTRYQSYRSKPLQLFYADVDQDSVVETLVTYFDQGLGKRAPFRGLDLLGSALPFLRERFRTHEAFAKASIEEIFPQVKAQTLEATWLDSTVFLNRGKHFEAIPLPVEAQMAPAFAVCVADFNGDGHEDIFLAQNFFALHPETPRLDGGTGLLLVGKGDGHFTALSPRESGLRIFGEQRGCAAADFNRDGRWDLAVGQNGAATKLYRNETARPGMRVVLSGSAGNSTAVGAVVRVGDDQGWGPAREIHLGSGYLSTDSPVPVTTFSRKPTRVEVRWPGGAVKQQAIAPDATEIKLSL